MWYGINDRMANKILTTPESEWLITLALDIDQFYDYNGFVGLWMHTQGAVCFLEMETADENAIYFKVSDNYDTCS